jgi:hypothetical protein
MEASLQAFLILAQGGSDNRLCALATSSPYSHWVGGYAILNALNAGAKRKILASSQNQIPAAQF